MTNGRKVLLRHLDHPGVTDIDTYMDAGGYKIVAEALDKEPARIIEEVKKSGLRGRGGAGFPTGLKWAFAAAETRFPKTLICNADEGEPGTFKDKPILEYNPHLLIEGMILSAHALQAQRGVIYLRGEYPHVRTVLDRAIGQARDKNLLGDSILGGETAFHLFVHQGAGAYICGEETALIDSLEGKRGQPRAKPPFPVNSGAWTYPTVVNNVESLANIPYILEIGGAAYAGIGNPECPGPKLFSVSGCVTKPGVYELPMGTPLTAIIHEHAGGLKQGRTLKAVIPGGVSTPVLPAAMTDCAMDYLSMQKIGSFLGSGAVIVIDDSICLVKVTLRIMRFFEHESCGKCTPCREGNSWMRMILERIENGNGQEDDIALLDHIANAMTGTTFCPLGDSAAGAVMAMLQHFRDEFTDHVKNAACTLASRVKS